MKTAKTSPFTALLLFSVFLGLTGCSQSESAETPTPPPTTAANTDQTSTAGPAAGHWEGAIVLPGTELEIRVDLANHGGWNGFIDIPVQGLRGFELGDVLVDGESVSFALPNIPGDPVFKGTLTGDAIRGAFSQAGQTFEFRLARAEKKLERGETPSQGVVGEGFAGVWQGSLKVNVFELRLLFKLATDGEGVTGTMDSLDQNTKDLPITEGLADGNKLKLELQRIGGTFNGELSADGSEIRGQWMQGGQKMPLTLYRLDKAPDLSRPQDPRKPYPYNEKELVFRNEDAQIRLAGTLTYPKTGGPHPAVVLITGSGAQDRDESLMGHRPFLVLADHLTRNGIAVLRFDDRGFGKSEGRFSEAVTEDFVGDALSAVAFLKSQKEVDAKRIGLVGHSEGGLVAPMAAVKSDDVAFIVLLAGVGVPMNELLARQAEDILRVMGGNDEMAEGQGEIQRRIFDLVRTQGDAPDIKDQVRAVLEGVLGEFTDEQRRAMGVNEAQINNQVNMVTSKWFRKLLEIDPRPTLEQVDVPVLAINGKKDIQVAWEENLGAIEESLKKGGNTNVTIKAFEDMNHLFQKCKTGAVAEYGTIEETFNPLALETVSEWIRKTAGVE